MVSNPERKIKMLISAHHKLLAQVALYEAQQKDTPRSPTAEMEAYVTRLKRLLEYIDCLMLLVSEEERYILELHLISGMKWESVMAEYQNRWPYDKGTDKRTYLYRQQAALKKMSAFIKQYSNRFDFSWLDDRMIDEIANL